MLRHKTVSLRLAGDDLEQLASGDVLEVTLEDGVDLKIDLDQSGLDLLSGAVQQQSLDLTGDNPPIPEDLESLQYQQELLPLAGEYDVIERTGGRSKDALIEELRSIRENHS